MFLILLGKYLGVEWLGHMITLCLTFWETGKLVFQSSCTKSFTSNIWGFQFLYIVTNTCYCHIFLRINFFFNKFYLFIYLFIYLWLCWVFVAVCRLSLVAASGDYSSLRCTGFSLRWLLLLQSTSSRRVGFSSCGMGSVVVAHGLSCSAACGIFQTRARTRVPCIGRRILNHCATREAPGYLF